MLNITQILEQLDSLPERFDADYTAGEYCRAAMDYEDALLVSGFIHMDDLAREQLISRFDQDRVERAYRAAGWYEEAEDADGARDRKEAV